MLQPSLVNQKSVSPKRVDPTPNRKVASDEFIKSAEQLKKNFDKAAQQHHVARQKNAAEQSSFNEKASRRGSNSNDRPLLSELITKVKKNYEQHQSPKQFLQNMSAVNIYNRDLESDKKASPQFHQYLRTVDWKPCLPNMIYFKPQPQQPEIRKHTCRTSVKQRTNAAVPGKGYFRRKPEKP